MEMNTFRNQTVLSSHANALVAFISLLSAHFSTRRFMVISDVEKQILLVKFQKMTSKLNLEVGFGSSKYEDEFKMVENEGYLILGSENSVFNYSAVTLSRPKLIVFAFLTNDESFTLPEFLLDLTIHELTSFFVIKISDNPTGFESSQSQSLGVKGKCYRIYKPVREMAPKVFPTLYLGGNDEDGMKWYWETKEMDWNYYEKEIKDMRGINLTLALASYLDKEEATQEYWKAKTSFFWRELKQYLGFSLEINVVKLSRANITSITNIYTKLIRTRVDGLGIMPVMSSERDKYLDFVTTGLDSRYHLLVKNPEFLYSWQSVFKPLSNHAWMYLGVTVLSMTMILKLIAWKWNYKSMDTSNCFLTIVGFVCCQSSSNIPRNISARLICFTSLLFSFYIYQFYTSNFYSILSTKEASVPFTSLDQFLDKHTHNLYIHPDTAVYAFISTAKTGIFKRIWDEVLHKDPIHQLTKQNRVKCLSNVCRGKAAILGQPFQTMQMKELTCKLVPVNSGFFPSNVVTVLRKKFPFKWQFKFVHSRLLEGGISHRFKEQYLGNMKTGPKTTSVTNQPVSMEQVSFLFAISAASFILGVLILGIENLTFKSFSRKQRRTVNASELQIPSWALSLKNLSPK